MGGLPLALILSIALWALIVELTVGLATLADEAPATTVLAELAAAAPRLMAAAMLEPANKPAWRSDFEALRPD